MKRLLVYTSNFAFILVFSNFTFAKKLEIEDFTASPDIYHASISPDGTRIAGVWDRDDGRYVLVYDIKNRKMTRGVGDKFVRPFHVSWANNNMLLVKLLVPYYLDKAKEDAQEKDDFDIDDYSVFGRVVSYNLETGELVELLSAERGLSRNYNLANISHYLRNDKNHILMNASRKDRLNQFKVNIHTGEATLVARAGKRTFSFVNDEDGNLLYRLDYMRDSKYIKIYRFISKNDWEEVERIYLEDDNQDKNKIDIKDLAGRHDDSLVYRKLNPETGYFELVKVIDGKAQSFISLPNQDIISAITSAYSSEIIGYRTLNDVYRSHYFNEEINTRYQALAAHFEQQNFSVSSRSENNKVWMIMSSGVDNPASYHYVQDDGELVFFEYAYSTLPSDELAKGAKIQLKTRDNLIIDSYILLPKEFDGSSAFPLVVLPHGGPHARDSIEYDDFAQFIATRGYIVAKVNFRGSTGYGKAFKEAGFKQWGQGMQNDLEDLVKALISEKIVESKKVCIVGASYGGYAALMGPINAPDMYQCSVSINGVTHLPKQIEFDKAKFDEDTFQEYIVKRIGDPSTEMGMLKANSPAIQSHKLDVPVLLIHGEDDTVVPEEQSDLMRKVLKKQGKEVKAIFIEDAGHNIFNYEEDTIRVYQEVEEFLAKHLK